MRLPPAAEFAVRGATALAGHYGNGPLSLDSICAAQGLPKPYLTKIFASLTRAGLITPVRGKHGGYLLAKAPGQISLLEVIEAVQGPVNLNFCTHDPPRCDREQCPMRPVWKDLQAHLRKRLAAVTLGNGATVHKAVS